ncbi:9518_t:CDS:2, partial [Scutellospora calospora]
MLFDLFRKTQINKPKSVRNFRRSVIIISIGLLIAIIKILSIEVHNELPSINTTYSTANNLPIINLYFYYDNSFNITCILTNDHVNNSNCTEYVTYMTYPDSPDGHYVGKFLPNYNVNSDTGDSQFRLQYDNFDPNSETIVNTTDTFDLSLVDKNLHFLSQSSNDFV